MNLLGIFFIVSNIICTFATINIEEIIMQYWINHNGVQTGPLELDAIKEMKLTSKAFVWHEGLNEWVNITQVPELQGFYMLEQAQDGVVTGQPVQPTQQQTSYQPAQQQPQYAGQQPAQDASAAECPPTNLVWAIISTLLCCLPAGIVAIIYAIKVQNKYREGDIEGAKRASETGAWWCIASIILGILTWPLISLFQMQALS